MNLAELQARYDEFVQAVASRIRTGGKYAPQDPEAVLDAAPAQFKLRAMTVPAPSDLYFSARMREVLQTSASVEALADEFIDRWQEQKAADESI